MLKLLMDKIDKTAEISEGRIEMFSKVWSQEGVRQIVYTQPEIDPNMLLHMDGILTFARGKFGNRRYPVEDLVPILEVLRDRMMIGVQLDRWTSYRARDVGVGIGEIVNHAVKYHGFHPGSEVTFEKQNRSVTAVLIFGRMRDM